MDMASQQLVSSSSQTFFPRLVSLLRKVRTAFLLVALSVLLAGVLSSCGGGGSSDSAKTTTTKTVETTTTEAAWPTTSFFPEPVSEKEEVEQAYQKIFMTGIEMQSSLEVDWKKVESQHGGKSLHQVRKGLKKIKKDNKKLIDTGNPNVYPLVSDVEIKGDTAWVSSCLHESPVFSDVNGKESRMDSYTIHQITEMRKKNSVWKYYDTKKMDEDKEAPKCESWPAPSLQF